MGIQTVTRALVLLTTILCILGLGMMCAVALDEGYRMVVGWIDSLAIMWIEGR